MIYLLGTTPHPKAKHLGVIEVCLLPLSFSCDGFDAIVLTSKSAVASLEASKISWHHLPVYVIGKGTQEAAQKAGATVAYVAKEAYGERFALETISLLQGKKVLFPRAKEVVSDVAGLLQKEGVLIHDVVAYETVCVPCETLSPPLGTSVMIFTSPSSVRCFLRCFSWDSSWQAVSIGKKTAEAFPKEIISHISPVQTVDACVELAQGLYVDLSKNPI
ncbi:MAG: uroporphyrinogen-III synthase [Campylobacterales bacterium]|nr:uroporphyrinogen-III synthase [Campylobacterales bacterium]